MKSFHSLNHIEITNPIDFAIITALKIERDAILRRLDSSNTLQEDDDPHTYYYGHITIPKSGEHYQIVVVMLLGMGNDNAATTTTRLIQRWAPQSVIFVGIAGGILNKVALGDVVVADFSHYYEPAKLTPAGDQRRPQQFPSDRLLYGRALAYEASDWKKVIDVKRPRITASKSSSPEAHFGVIGSGEKVIADEKTIPRLLEESPKLLAVAMEGAGVARAASYYDPPPRFLEIRGICDFANSQKNDDWQIYAANTAAAFTIGFLRSRPLSPMRIEIYSSSSKTAPLLLLVMQSLRQIGPDELLRDWKDEFGQRDVEIVSLDFTDLVVGGVLTDPANAAQRLGDPQGLLFETLGRVDKAELAFHGLAHIPLVILAGFLTTDRQPVRFFDFFPDPGLNNWVWPNDLKDIPSLEVRGLPEQSSLSVSSVVVRISISYLILPLQTQLAVPDADVEVDLTISGLPPMRSIVRSEKQVQEYGQVFRQTIDLIAQRFPNAQRIHLFYAGPVALAFHIGQQISGNIHPPVLAWNFRRNSGLGYEWAIDLTSASMGDKCVIQNLKSVQN